MSLKNNREKETCHAQFSTGVHLGAHICIYICVPHRGIVHRSLGPRYNCFTLFHLLSCFLSSLGLPLYLHKSFLTSWPLAGSCVARAILELLVFLFHVASANINCTPHLLVLLACFVSPLLTCVIHVVWGHQLTDGQEVFS